MKKKNRCRAPFGSFREEIGPVDWSSAEDRARYQRAYRKRYPDYRAPAWVIDRPPRKPGRASKYGLTRAEYEELLGRACAICGERTEPMHIDHDHITGAVRGLLCSRCNPGLGFFQDDPARLIMAAKYLIDAA